jgi:DNA-binding Xre family transcriptional regulator
MRHMDNDIDGRYNQAVADILRERKEDMGISFDALATATGLPRATVSRLIYGSRDIKVYALRRICQVLELNVGDVLSDASKKL